MARNLELCPASRCYHPADCDGPGRTEWEPNATEEAMFERRRL